MKSLDVLSLLEYKKLFRWLGIAYLLEDDQATHPSTYFVRRSSAIFILMFIWAFFSPLDVSSVCEGEIIPAGQVKKVQHLEGGIIQEILVREGEIVKKDQPLVTMQGASNQADTKELEARIGGLKIRVLRLDALLKNASALVIPKALADAYPEQAQIAYGLFRSHRDKISVASQGQGHKVVHRQGELSENDSRIQQITAHRAVLMEQVVMNDRLRKEGLSSEYERLELKKQLSVVDGQLIEAKSAVTRLQAQIAEEQSAQVSVNVNDRDDLKKDLDDSSRQIDELTERLTKFSDASQRTTVRAPLDGVIMAMNVRARGEVLSPGGVVLSLVPSDEHMLAEVKLPVSEVGFVKVGQLARLQLSADVSRGFTPISGHVVFISPDAVTQESKPPYFMVRILTDKVAFERGNISYRLTPGVPISGAIVTGHRTVLMYILDPLLGGLNFALNER